MTNLRLARPLTALFFSLSALAIACVGEPPSTDPDGGNGNCTPSSCKAKGFECGTQDNGCGQPMECGSCEAGACTAGKCACVPKTCPDVGAQCGKIPDGCGGTLDCGTCGNASDACNTQTNKCECKPKDCTAQGVECGAVPDGCGGTSQCGTCASNPKGPNCSAGKCGPNACTPKKCADLGKNCGQVSDGCGGILDCGQCALPQTCGGNSVANVCGCTAKTCPQLGKNCGSVPDQCGGSLNCGTCTGNDTCGGTGIPNVCGCKPYKCTKADCGLTDDGCGGTIDCGVCTCFVGSTPVLMADGSMRPIETLKRGELVMGYDESTGKTSPHPVDALATHGVEESAKGLIVINDSIRSTPNHPFYVGGRRVRAGDLKVGDVVRTAVVGDHGAVTLKDVPVTSLSVVQAAVPSYDVTMVPPAGYFVGPSHLLVLIKVPQ